LPALATLWSDQVLVGDEFMTVLLKNCARKTAAAHNENFLVVLFEFFDERDEVAIAADYYKCVDMIPREGHLECVQRKIDVGSVLVTTGREIPLHHLNCVLRHAAAMVAGPFPISIGDFRDNFAAFLYGLQNGANIKMAIQRAFDSDLDVVEVDEYSNL